MHKTEKLQFYLAYTLLTLMICSSELFPSVYMLISIYLCVYTFITPETSIYFYSIYFQSCVHIYTKHRVLRSLSHLAIYCDYFPVPLNDLLNHDLIV